MNGNAWLPRTGRTRKVLSIWAAVGVLVLNMTPDCLIGFLFVSINSFHVNEMFVLQWFYSPENEHGT